MIPYLRSLLCPIPRPVLFALSIVLGMAGVWLWSQL